MALSEPILPSFSTFASPCRERGLQEARSPTTATGTAAAGSSRAQTSSRATTASTPATGPSSATSATAPSRAPTTWRCT
uniref:KLF transcription factor 2 n=1 Tax=Microcebus murinus TaxID=30608 RepID=A0A8C5W2L3_MICMU